jgi:hypothetical protein
MKSPRKTRAAKTAAKDAAEYVTNCEDWISKITAETAQAAEDRFDCERDLRDTCAVPISERGRLRYLLRKKVETFEASK